MVSATRSLQLLLDYLEEAGGRMRAQGLSVQSHSHCGNQQLVMAETAAAAAAAAARMVTVRIQPSSGKATEIHTSPAQTVQAFRLVSHARRGGGDWSWCLFPSHSHESCRAAKDCVLLFNFLLGLVGFIKILCVSIFFIASTALTD